MAKLELLQELEWKLLRLLQLNVIKLFTPVIYKCSEAVFLAVCDASLNEL
jgi:hypothetical protein